jgi:hypothetical protein
VVRPLPSKQARIKERNAILNAPYVPPSEPPVPPKPEAYVLLALGAIRVDPESMRLLREYAPEDGVLHCHGDEVSLCCPFALDRATQAVPVIAGGVLAAGPPEYLTASAEEYRLLVEDICRVKGFVQYSVLQAMVTGVQGGP